MRKRKSTFWILLLIYSFLALSAMANETGEEDPENEGEEQEVARDAALR